jgi:signal transduction histidine kinase
MLLQYAEVLVLILINSGGIFFIIVLLANSLREKLYIWLTAMVVCIIGWVNFAYLGYIDPDLLRATFFYRLNLSFVAILLFIEYMLYIDSFLGLRKKFLKWPIAIISSIFFFAILFSNLLISGANRQSWGNEIIFGPFNTFFNIFAFTLNIGIVIALVSRYYSLSPAYKKKTLFFLVGTFLFIFLNILFNIIIPVSLQTARYQHFGDYSSVFFLFFTAYAILRHKFMNVKIALTAILIGVMSMFVFIDIFSLSHSPFELSIKITILVLFVIISIFLVRSVLNEIQQREELTKTNKALDQSRQKYKELAKEQEDIIDIIGHELRAPIATILQTIYLYKETGAPYRQKMIQIMKKDIILVERLKLFLDSFSSIERSSKHALTLVNSLLETVRIDTNMIRITKTEFDISSLVKEVGESYALLMADSVHIHLKLPQKTVLIQADKVKIEQALHELIRNGIKYKKIDAQLPVSLTVSLQKTAHEVHLSVTDEGRGINPEKIPFLGSKFKRLNEKKDNPISKQPGGTGLGLYIVRTYMEKHQGRLVIESKGEGQGTTCTLVIPIDVHNVAP